MQTNSTLHNIICTAKPLAVRMLVQVLLILSISSPVLANIGDSRSDIDKQSGEEYLIQTEDRRIWLKDEYRSGDLGKVRSYGYLSNIDGFKATRWIEYDNQERVIKETVLFDKAIQLREYKKYYRNIYEAIADEQLYRIKFYSGDRLGALVPVSNQNLNEIQFFVAPDSTKINMHSLISGFEIKETTTQRIKDNLADNSWQITDNYFEDRLLFSEKLLPRAKTDMIVIHHTAKDSMSVPDIHAYHLTKGWAGIAYHQVILPDGTIQDGRPEETIGAHALGANPRSIGIVVVGNFENKAPSAIQMDTLVKLTLKFMHEYNIPVEHVVPHREVTKGTTCPGKQFPWNELMNELKAGILVNSR
ncbi:peptidoglycan recognition protein family protein [Dendrosporobacter sp. 1207_IL3150]|uniref:peptidoglycan recognition protein family protein n=1 Tax=Dendrosporobacter sp. 1207_IL3150 TaxID=3084054 RepID=UPI002FDB40A8